MGTRRCEHGLKQAGCGGGGGVAVAVVSISVSVAAGLERRKLNLKAKHESSSSHFPFKSLVPGAFNMGFIASTCTALPGGMTLRSTSPMRSASVLYACAQGLTLVHVRAPLEQLQDTFMS